MMQTQLIKEKLIEERKQQADKMREAFLNEEEEKNIQQMQNYMEKSKKTKILFAKKWI